MTIDTNVVLKRFEAPDEVRNFEKGKLVSARDAVGDVVFLHAARSAADVIFRSELSDRLGI